MTEHQEKVYDMLAEMRFAMFTTTTEAGALESRPMTVQEIRDGGVYFIAQRTSRVTCEADGKPVNLAFCKGHDYVSLSGVARISDDVALKQELWNSATDAYTEGGPQNPDNVVIIVEAESAAYWDSPSAPIMLVSMVKAHLTGERPQAGTSGATEL